MNSYRIYFNNNTPVISVEADTFGLAEGFFIFAKVTFTKEFGPMNINVAAHPAKDVEAVVGSPIENMVEAKKPLIITQ